MTEGLGLFRGLSLRNKLGSGVGPDLSSLHLSGWPAKELLSSPSAASYNSGRRVRGASLDDHHPRHMLKSRPAWKANQHSIAPCPLSTTSAQVA